MRDATVLQGEHWRIGILTESLIRLEWSDSGEFEDRLTQMAVNRDFGADPEFTVTHRNGAAHRRYPCTLPDLRRQTVQQGRAEHRRQRKQPLIHVIQKNT